MKHRNLMFMTLFCLSFLAFATGCTHMIPISVQPTVLPSSGKLPIHVVVVLNKDLAEYKHEYSLEGDTFVYLYGQPLQSYARQTANASFKQVDEATSTEEAFTNTSADIVLVPRPVKADQSFGLATWSKVNLTLVIEWKALDRVNKNTIWLKTITADASETQGNLFTGKKHFGILTQKLFDDLSLKTYSAFQEAPELRSTQP